MDIYEQIHAERMARYERRAERIKRQERRERILGPIRLGLQVILGTAIVYLYLFFGCLWASM